MKNLEQYLKENLEKGIINHSIRVSKGHLGVVTFYIHPLDEDGDTLDFMVHRNELEQIEFKDPLDEFYKQFNENNE